MGAYTIEWAAQLRHRGKAAFDRLLRDLKSQDAKVK
jgi:hypothetical protein